MDSGPLASIIITTYYRNEALRGAIESAKAQTHRPTEIVVVDDSGEGHAAPVINDSRVTYIPKDANEGPISAWNTGIEHCSGKYVQFLDDDDRIRPTKIEKQVQLLESSEDTGAVYCGMEWESGERKSPRIRRDVLRDVLTLKTSPCVTSTLLIRRTLLDRILPLPTYPASTDNVLKIELARRTEFDFVDEPLMIRGQSNDNISRSMKKINGSWKILDDYRELYRQYPSDVRKAAVSNIYQWKGRLYYDRNPFSLRARALLLYSIVKSPGFTRNDLATFLRTLGGEYTVSLGKRIKNTVDRLP
jgi:glycosyltransferase involved in cell wall biosynthesis